MSWRARRRWALVILLLGLPLYIIAAVSLVGLFERPGVLAELAIYVGLGVLWALPFRFVFRGVARADPEDGPASSGGERC
jgi:uncharacterized SAM-binding protein YcdF (DUF218 family)